MNNQYIVVECPHCKHLVYIVLKELNCQIFRHGIFKNNYQQIDPHLSKEKCEELVKTNSIYGCSKPFKIVHHNGSYKAVVCEYI